MTLRLRWQGFADSQNYCCSGLASSRLHFAATEIDFGAACAGEHFASVLPLIRGNVGSLRALFEAFTCINQLHPMHAAIVFFVREQALLSALAQL